MIGTRIILRFPKNLPEWLASQGQITFDLYSDHQFKRTKKLEELTDLDEISTEGVLGFSLPKTEKNVAILNQYSNPINHGIRKNVEPIHVVCFDGSITLRQNILIVVGDNSKEWEVQLVDGDEFWRDRLKQVYPCDLDFGEFQLTEANLRANWLNPKYEDGDQCLYFPLVHYGNWSEVAAEYDDAGELIGVGDSNESDFRPWIHALAFMQKAFCSIGWKFRSPIFETDWGRRLILYMLAPLNGSDGLDKFKFRAVVQSDYKHIPGADPIWLPGQPSWLIYDSDRLHAYDTAPGGFDNSSLYTQSLAGVPRASLPGIPDHIFFEGYAGEMTFTVDCVISTLDSGDHIRFYWSIAIIDSQDPDPITAFIQPLRSPDFHIYNDKVRCRYTTPVIDMEPTWRVLISPTVDYIDPLQGTGFGEYIISGGGEWYNTPISYRFVPDMNLKIAAYLSCENSALDYLKGLMHLIGKGAILTDPISKTVTVYQREETFIWGVSPDPYYSGERVDSGIVCDSHKSTIRIGVEKRYYRLAFQNPDDSYSQRLGFSDTNPLYGKLIDFGEYEYEDDIKEDLNPIFEATANIIANDLGHDDFTVGGETIEGAVEIPALWDNDEYEKTEEVQPRILYALGYTSQFRGDDISTRYASWSFKGVKENDFPVAFQLSNQQYGSAADFRLENVCYGDLVNDLYTLFWRGYLLELQNSLLLEYSAFIDPKLFHDTTFRKYVYVMYNGVRYLAKLISITDYVNNSTSPSKIEVIPVIDCGDENENL